MIPLIDLEYAEWLLAGVAVLGVIAGAWLEFRRDGARMRELEIEVRLHDRRLELLENRWGYDDDEENDAEQD